MRIEKTAFIVQAVIGRNPVMLPVLCEMSSHHGSEHEEKGKSGVGGESSTCNAGSSIRAIIIITVKRLLMINKTNK